MTNKKTWVKKRHVFCKRLMYAYLSKKYKKKYDITWDEYELEAGKNYLILFNHQTDYDQVVIGLSFPKVPIYYVSTEDFFTNGFKSRLMKFAVNPIPIKKQTIDALAARRCMKVAKEGGTIAIAPEGNRTFSGVTCVIRPSIAKLVKKIKLPLIFYNIVGGYGIQPRWADSTRSGNLHGSIKRILEYDDYKDLSDSELFEIIKNNLYQDEYSLKSNYYGENTANYLERVFYYCPHCGISEFESSGSSVKCKKCGMEVTYNPDKTFYTKDPLFKYKNPYEWYKAQENYILNLDTTSITKQIATDTVSLYKVIYLKKKVLIDDNAIISLYKDKYIIKTKKEELELKFGDVSATSVLGRNKINIYINDDMYQIKPQTRFNALKYVHFYYRYRADIGKNDDKYLGM